MRFKLKRMAEIAASTAWRRKEIDRARGLTREEEREKKKVAQFLLPLHPLKGKRAKIPKRITDDAYGISRNSHQNTWLIMFSTAFSSAASYQRKR